MSKRPLLSFHLFFDNIPKIEWRGDDYIGYYGVVGKPLEKADLSIDAERKVGVKIGEFLKRLHSITPPNGMKRLSIDEEIDEHRQTFRQAKPILLHGLWSEEDSRKVTTLFALEMPLGLRKLGFDPVLCHGDLGAQNIILKDDGDVGFIDFGDAGVYDRAVDFMWLEREQQEEALEAYGADDVLRQKVAIRRKLAPVLNMPYFRDEDNGRELRKHMKKIHNALV